MPKSPRHENDRDTLLSLRPTNDRDTLLSLRPGPTAATSAAVTVYLQAVPEKDPTTFKAELTPGHWPNASESLLLDMLNTNVLTEKEFRVTEVFKKSKDRFAVRLQTRLQQHYASAQIHDVPRIRWKHSYAAAGSRRARLLVMSADGETMVTSTSQGSDIGLDPAPSPNDSSKGARRRATPDSESTKHSKSSAAVETRDDTSI